MEWVLAVRKRLLVALTDPSLVLTTPKDGVIGLPDRLTGVNTTSRSPIINRAGSTVGGSCCDVSTHDARGGTVIRTVEPDDIAIFYDQQDDPVASEMAAFPVRDRSAHEAHWAKILADDACIARTIVDGDLVVGNIGSFLADGERNIGYWIGRQYWGRGYATAAVAELVAEVGSRPLHAHVAEHNVGSIRVLAKCGFVAVGEEHAGDPVKEIILRLDA